LQHHLWLPSVSGCARMRPPHAFRPTTETHPRWLLRRSWSRIVRAVDDVDTAALENGAATNRPLRASAGVYTGMDMRQGADEGDASVQTADLLSRARAGEGDAFREITEPPR